MPDEPENGEVYEFTLDEYDADERIDQVLSARLPDLSRTHIQKLIRDGKLTVNGKVCDVPRLKFPAGSVAVLTDDLPAVPLKADGEDIPLDVVHEDDDLLVVNKPKGMVVHPAPGNYTGTLVNALLYHCKDSLSGVGGVIRPGIVHRIDKDTSGLLVVAKNDAAHLSLAKQLETHAVSREYRALVFGGFSEDSGTVDAPIGRHPVDRKKMAVLSHGATGAREAITHYEVLGRYGQISYLRLRLETGRTHQIRVHMSYRGHPLLGDEVYGRGASEFERRHKALFSGQALHAVALELTHPRTEEKMRFECELPDEFKKALEILEKTV